MNTTMKMDQPKPDLRWEVREFTNRTLSHVAAAVLTAASLSVATTSRFIRSTPEATSALKMRTAYPQK